jgi:hypothetical protein
MTYSNRSEGSPFQHRSEFDKSPPVDTQLKMNPFLNNMPGTWSQPYNNAKPAPPPQNGKSALSDPEPSPICDWATTWGDNTVSLCKPPYTFAPKLSCPMSRLLVPERNIDPGMWYYNRLDKEKDSKKPSQFMTIILILIAIIVILQMRSSK